jgi:hypothetical protein
MTNINAVSEDMLVKDALVISCESSSHGERLKLCCWLRDQGASGAGRRVPCGRRVRVRRQPRGRRQRRRAARARQTRRAVSEQCRAHLCAQSSKVYYVTAEIRLLTPRLRAKAPRSRARSRRPAPRVPLVVRRRRRRRARPSPVLRARGAYATLLDGTAWLTLRFALRVGPDGVNTRRERAGRHRRHRRACAAGRARGAHRERYRLLETSKNKRRTPG